MARQAPVTPHTSARQPSQAERPGSRAGEIAEQMARHTRTIGGQSGVLDAAIRVEQLGTHCADAGLDSLRHDLGQPVWL